jgi:uncharacterized protein (TIRG00374 family)
MRIPRAARLLILLSLGIAAFTIFFISLHANLDEVRVLIRSVGIPILLLALILDILNIVSYGSAWYFLVHTIHPTVRIRKCVQGVMISIFGDILIPTASVTGEALRVAFANKEFNLPYSQGFATTLVHRVLNVFAFAGVLGVSSIILLVGGGLPPGLRVEVFLLLIIVTIPEVLGVLVLRRPSIVTKIVTSVSRLFAFHPRTERFVKRLLEIMEDFEKAVSLIRVRIRVVLVAFAFLLLQWLFQILIPYVFLIGVSIALQVRGIDYWTYFWLVALAFPLYGLVNLMPIGIPAMAGVLDSAMAGTFILLGFPPEVAITTTLLTRIVIVLFESTLTGTVTILSGYQGVLRDRKDIVEAQ